MSPIRRLLMKIRGKWALRRLWLKQATCLHSYYLSNSRKEWPGLFMEWWVCMECRKVKRLVFEIQGRDP